MIVLWGVEDDTPLAAVRAALAPIGAPHFFLDQSRAGETAIEFSAGDCLAGEIRLAGARCDLARVSAIYLRCNNTRAATPGAQSDEGLAQHADRLDAVMTAFLDVTAARVVNPVEAMATNGSKPYQSAIIAAHGFAVPDTLITSDPDEVGAFAARHGEIIYKSISGVRSIVTRLRPEHSDRLADLVWCPTQFQQYVPGRDYRVHVVGEAVFAAEIVSDADDYRYAASQGEDATIHASRVPLFLEGRCRTLTAVLGYALAGIDLRLTPQGEWYCFEVNPSPAFTYYASATEQPIAQAVAELLAAS
jgi:glutathione synthase/RimK-type ligase-like ATP-grasp enzyme